MPTDFMALATSPKSFTEYVEDRLLKMSAAERAEFFERMRATERNLALMEEVAKGSILVEFGAGGSLLLPPLVYGQDYWVINGKFKVDRSGNITRANDE